MSNQNQQPNNPLPGRPNLFGNGGNSPVNRPNNNRSSNNNNPIPQNGQNNNGRSSLRSHFSRPPTELISWTIQPAADIAVKFSLDGLGNPFYRLLGKQLDTGNHSVEAITKTLQTDCDLHDALVNRLNVDWESYAPRGRAILLYQNTNLVWGAYSGFVHPLPDPPPRLQQSEAQQNEENFEDDEELPRPTRTFQCYRAIDLSLVLNVLGRTRGQVLAANTPLALESGFLNRSFICDNPGLVAVAQATGCIEESWS